MSAATGPRLLRAIAACGLVAALLAACAGHENPTSSSPVASHSPAARIGAVAPDFSLFDQFDHLRRLSEFRGDIVMLTFASSRCTNICPLTAELLRQTRTLLGSVATRAQLLAVNTNYRYTSVQDVYRWSKQHSMTHRWLFLTAPFGTLIPVWKAYGITGGGAHTTVVFVIDASGRIRALVPIATQQGIGAEARSLARYVDALAR